MRSATRAFEFSRRKLVALLKRILSDLFPIVKT